jgi:hypothetical protein
MKISAFRSLIILIGLLFLASLTVDAQWVTIARKVKSLRTGDTDIANVIIDAGTANVYKAAIDTLTSNPKVRFTSRDNAKRLVQFSNEMYSVSMQVDSLAAGLCQVTVAAESTGIPPRSETDAAVNVIFGVCHKAGIKCVLDK